MPQSHRPHPRRSPLSHAPAQLVLLDLAGGRSGDRLENEPPRALVRRQVAPAVALEFVVRSGPARDELDEGAGRPSAAFAFMVFPFGLFWGWLYDRHPTLIGVVASHLLIGIFGVFVVSFPVL